MSGGGETTRFLREKIFNKFAMLHLCLASAAGAGAGATGAGARTGTMPATATTAAGGGRDGVGAVGDTGCKGAHIANDLAGEVLHTRDHRGCQVCPG